MSCQSLLRWIPLEVNDPNELLSQREGHSSCVLSTKSSIAVEGGLDHDTHPHLLIAGGYSANGDSSDIVAVSIGSEGPLGGSHRVSVVGSSNVTARDGAVLHALPSSLSSSSSSLASSCVPSVALGFGGVHLDSYDHCDSCFVVVLNEEAGQLSAKAFEVACVSDAQYGCPAARCRPSSCMVIAERGGKSEFYAHVRLRIAREQAGLKENNEKEAVGDSDNFVTVSTDWALLLFGGEDSNGNVLNDLWILKACPFGDEAEEKRDTTNIVPEGTLYWTRITESDEATDDKSKTLCPSGRYLAAFPKTLPLLPSSSSSEDISLLLYGGACYNSGGAVASNNELWELSLGRGTLFGPPKSDSNSRHIARWRRLVDGFELLPRCNGHTSAALAHHGTLFFGGKDFEEGNDDIHLLLKKREEEERLPESGEPDGYRHVCMPCPFAEDLTAYVNIDEDVGGTGIGVWPHWRYTATLDELRVSSHTQAQTYLLLTCGECRHNDTVPIYVMYVGCE